MDGRRRKTVHAARRPEERPKDASHSSMFTECTSAMLTLPSFAGPTSARSVTRTVRMRFSVGTGCRRLRHLRGRRLSILLRAGVGPPESGARSLLPLVVGWVLRRHRFGARHRVACGGLAGGAELPATRAGGGGPGSLDDFAHPPRDRCGDAPGGVHVGPAAPGGRRPVETYVRVKGRWCYLYRALDSTGATIDFVLSVWRDAGAARRLFRTALTDPSHPQPRVINTDQARLYGSAISGVKKEGILRRRCRHRPVQYLNNIVEQDHRAIKRRVKAKQWFREFQAARRTIQGYEAIHMIRKGQARWVSGSDVRRQIQFLHRLFEVAA